MNPFKKLPVEKRNELIMVVLVTVGVLLALGFGLIRPQYASLDKLAKTKSDNQATLDDMMKKITLLPRTQAELAASSKVLAEQEDTMASGDLFSWFIGVLRPFKQNYRVDIPQIGTPVKSEVNLLPKFPYQQATLSLAGTARFYELGRFVSDLENQFPHARLLNLDVGPASPPGEKDQLSFRVDLVMLVKPDAT